MSSNIVEYDLREIPHASDQPVSGYYPVVAQSMTFTTEGICRHASKASTLTDADIKGMLAMLREVLIDKLRQGQRVDLEGIGTFAPVLTSDEAIDDPNGKQLARHLHFSGVQFRPKKKLVSALAGVSFHRTKTPGVVTKLLTDAELMARLRSFRDKTGRNLFSRKDFELATGYSRARSAQALPRLVAEGFLDKLGTTRFPYYQMTDRAAAISEP